MSVFKCKGLSPRGALVEVEAEDWVDAAQRYQMEGGHPGGTLGYWVMSSPGESAYFAVVRVEDESGEVNETITRAYHRGIFRRGGVVRDTLSTIAKKIGWDGPLEGLLDPWDREGDWEKD